MRHFADIMRPTDAKGSRGQLEGQPSVLIADWPCEVTPLGGSERDASGGTLSEHTYQVAGYGDPGNPLATTDYLILHSAGGRTLKISAIDDPLLNGQQLVLTCHG